ncbi:hypothetical protein AB3Y40_07540 [Yoonia sp. R2331]|uniref:hypothetical protein n=1 Tax=Yoonia sp. R2331 TaxID=3237238 RepID=UPI0034E4347C
MTRKLILTACVIAGLAACEEHGGMMKDDAMMKDGDAAMMKDGDAMMSDGAAMMKDGDAMMSDG